MFSLIREVINRKTFVGVVFEANSRSGDGGQHDMGRVHDIARVRHLFSRRGWTRSAASHGPIKLHDKA